jgi:glycosyltransferase involved in cell wall biosynthesis
MKIGFDHQIFTMQSYGGISRYYSILANLLRKEAENIRIFTGIHRNKYLKDLARELTTGYGVEKYPPRSTVLFQCLNHAISQVQLRNWHPDIIHETYYTSMPPLSSKAGRVTTVYDMIHELFRSEFSSSDTTSVSKKLTLSRVDHIVSISNSTKEDLVNILGIDDKKITVVPLGVDLTAFQVFGTEVVTAETKPFILYVGSRGGYKNFQGLLAAVSQSKRLMSGFDVITFGGGRIDRKEYSTIRSLGFKEGQVRQVHGNDQRLATLYSKAACFVYPSLYEGFGLPPLEAMAAGCPVISSNTSSMPEVVRDAGIYFDPRDTEDMMNAIQQTVFSPTITNELVKLGYENIKRFSWNQCATKTLAVYEKLVGRSC